MRAVLRRLLRRDKYVTFNIVKPEAKPAAKEATITITESVMLQAPVSDGSGSLYVDYVGVPYAKFDEFLDAVFDQFEDLEHVKLHMNSGSLIAKTTVKQ